MEEVLTGIARDGKFGETDHLHAILFGLHKEALDLFRVKSTVSHPHIGDGCCYLDKSVLHDE